MTDKPWLEYVPSEDRDIYELANFGHSVGFGRRPAVLVVDVQYRTTGDTPAPIRQAIQDMYPTACGRWAWDAVDRIVPLLATARDAGVPIIYPYVAPKAAADLGAFGSINPAVVGIAERGYDFVAEVAPEPGDIRIPKRHASAFFGTALTSYLVDLGVDTVIVTGCTTSGCVRATVTDAFSYNFRTQVVSDCVYDRTTISHQIGLFDMDAKYADVVDSQRVAEYLTTI